MNHVRRAVNTIACPATDRTAGERLSLGYRGHSTITRAVQGCRLLAGRRSGDRNRRASAAKRWWRAPTAAAAPTAAVAAAAAEASTAALATAFLAVSRACVSTATVSAATVSATTLGLGNRRALAQETVEDLSRRGGEGGQHGDVHSGRWEQGCVDVGRWSRVLAGIRGIRGRPRETDMLRMRRAL